MIGRVIDTRTPIINCGKGRGVIGLGTADQKYIDVCTNSLLKRWHTNLMKLEKHQRKKRDSTAKSHKALAIV